MQYQNLNHTARVEANSYTIPSLSEIAGSQHGIFGILPDGSGMEPPADVAAYHNTTGAAPTTTAREALLMNLGTANGGTVNQAVSSAITSQTSTQGGTPTEGQTFNPSPSGINPYSGIYATPVQASAGSASNSPTSTAPTTPTSPVIPPPEQMPVVQPWTPPATNNQSSLPSQTYPWSYDNGIDTYTYYAPDEQPTITPDPVGPPHSISNGNTNSGTNSGASAGMRSGGVYIPNPNTPGVVTGPGAGSIIHAINGDPTLPSLQSGGFYGGESVTNNNQYSGLIVDNPTTNPQQYQPPQVTYHIGPGGYIVDQNGMTLPGQSGISQPVSNLVNQNEITTGDSGINPPRTINQGTSGGWTPPTLTLPANGNASIGIYGSPSASVGGA